MTIKATLKVAEKFIVDNSPGILTGLGVAGTITTAVLTGKAVRLAMMEIEEQRDPDHPHEFQIGEIIEQTWKFYIPPVVSGIGTVTCIIMANRIGTRRAAAIAAAFKLSEQLSEEYKERVVKALTPQKEEKIRSDLAKERMEKVGGHETIIITGSEVVFFDELSGRFFKNEMENVRKAVNDINHQVNNFYCASLSDFYEAIGLAKTSFSDDVGWNTDELLDIKFSAVMLDDGRPAIGITINTTPIRGFDRCQ